MSFGFGIIGCGMISRFHSRAIEDVKGAKLVACFDSFPAAADKLATAQAVGEKLTGLTVTISQKAGVDGRLFGSVTNGDVAEALVKAGFQVIKSQVRMPHGPLKAVGEFPVQVAAHTDVVVEITVKVVGETE